MEYKKKIQQIIIHSLKYIMNNNKCLDFDLLNNYNKFNMKMLKLTELKLYINNKLISKFCFHSHYIYNQIYDINYKPINKIDLLDLNNIDIEFYSSINGFNSDRNCVKIYIYSNLYLIKNKKVLFVSWLREAQGDVNRITQFSIKNSNGNVIYESISKNLSYQEILKPLISNYVFTKETALEKVKEMKELLKLTIEFTRIFIGFILAITILVTFDIYYELKRLLKNV